MGWIGLLFRGRPIRFSIINRYTMSTLALACDCFKRFHGLYDASTNACWLVSIFGVSSDGCASGRLVTASGDGTQRRT